MLVKLRRCILYAFVHVTIFSIHAQKLDSIQNILDETSKTDRNYVSLLTLLAKEYAENDPDSALSISRKAFTIANQQNWDSLKGQIYIALSTSHSYLAQYDSSTRYSFLAIETAENFNDTTTLIDGFNNLGIDFMFQEEDAKAIEYFEKVENLSKLSNDSLRWGHALNNIGMMVGYAGNTEDELDKYEQAANIFNAIGEKEGYANTLLNTGTVYTSIEQYQKADEFYAKALVAFEEINLSSGIQNTLQSSAENLMYMNQLAKANGLAQRALDLALQYEFRQDVVYTYNLLSQIAVKSGDYKTAFEYQAKENEVKEEIFNTEKSQQIAELETEYQTEKKEQQLAIAAIQLKQQVQEKYLLISAIVLITVVGGFIIYSVKKQASLQKKLLEEEMDHLRLKINSLLGNPEKVELDQEVINKSLHQPLSEREFEILNLTVADKTNREIADQVFVSVNTVKFHLKNIYSKLGVSNRREALKFAFDTSSN